MSGKKWKMENVQSKRQTENLVAKDERNYKDFFQLPQKQKI